MNMKILKTMLLPSALLLTCTPLLSNAVEAQSSTSAQSLIPIEHFVRHDKLDSMRISPTGKYLAMTVEYDESDGIVVVRTNDLSLVSSNRLVEGDRFVDLYWSSPERIVFSATRSQGRYMTRDATESWAAINADGSDFKRMWVARDRLFGSENSFKTPYFDVIGAPGNDSGKVLVSQFIIRDDKPAEELGELDTLGGKITPISRTPRYSCDIAMRLNVPVLAICPIKESTRRRSKDKTSGKTDDGGVEIFRYLSRNEWVSVRKYTGTAGRVTMQGWSDSGEVYVTHTDGHSTAAFGTIDPKTGEFHKLFHHPESDPERIIRSYDKTGTSLGVITEASLPSVTFFNGDHADVTLYSSLATAFPKKLVVPLNATADGRQFIFRVENDQSPPRLYLFDREKNQARLLMSHREWLDPDRMARVKPFVSTTRDGTKVRGYLTIPKEGNGKNLPMIVMVHGGPIGVRDNWAFDTESQLLASRGYLVLRVNFRGSEGFGESFSNKAYGQWGSGIMHDIIDATQWAIDQGYADKHRICIFGASFGGYAAMMAPTVDQGMFRCAFGYAGMYDAEIQMKKSDTSTTPDGLEYLQRALGATTEARSAISPVNRASLIRIPVYLAAGKDDKRCPPEHTVAMQKALIAAGNPPEGVIIQKGEGHGFEKPENNLKLYTEMLAFFERHIGDSAAKVTPAAH